MIASAVGLLAVGFVLVPASAGTSTARPPVSLTVAPARVALAGTAQTTVRVSNTGTSRAVVDVSRAGFALDLRGRPRIVRRGVRSAARWLTFRPQRFAVPARASRSLVVASRIPSGVEPGDHDALILLTSRPRADARLAVRMRLGVVVVVRAPGAVERRLRLGRLDVVRRGRTRVLELVVANRGNVIELLARRTAMLSLSRRGRRFATLVATGRTLRPRSRGIVEFPYRGRRTGRVTAHVTIGGEVGRSGVRRTYRLRL